MTGPAAIRRAQASDAAAVRDLTRKSYAKWVPVIGREPRPMTADHALAVTRHWIDLIEDDDGLAALVEMIPEAGFLLIENLAVREDRQGEGLGGLLLAHAEAIARETGRAEVRLYTNAAFAANLTFYGRKGYSTSGRTPLPDGGVMVHFVKSVS